MAKALFLFEFENGVITKSFFISSVVGTEATHDGQVAELQDGEDER